MDGRDASSKPLTLVVADGDEEARYQVRAALEPRGFAVTADPADAPSAIGAAIRLQPDLCLIDLALPGGGIFAVAEITRRVPATTVIAVAEASAPDDMIAALRRGAAGYLLKSMGGAELAKALRAAWHGEAAVSRAHVPALVEEVRGENGRELPLPTATVFLTPREWDVAEALRDGLTTDAIAKRLGVSQVTVRRHIARLLHTMGAPNRAAAIEALRMFAR